MGVPPRWLIRPAALHRSVLTLYLSSPPSGCNPDSDSSPLSLSPFREVLARSESTWLGILTPIQVSYLTVFLFNCQRPRVPSCPRLDITRTELYSTLLYNSQSCFSSTILHFFIFFVLQFRKVYVKMHLRRCIAYDNWRKNQVL